MIHIEHIKGIGTYGYLHNLKNLEQFHTRIWIDFAHVEVNGGYDSNLSRVSSILYIAPM